MNYRVLVFQLDTIYSPFKDPIKTLASPNAARTGGGAESPYVINAIKVGRMLDKEIIATVSDNGEICIWRTENLEEPPMILSNESSTWGLAIHSDQGLLGVSANNLIITVFNILAMTEKDPIFGTRTKPNILGETEKIELMGHEHNIPCIDFSRCGRYIASTSIDTTCKVWDISKRKVVTERKATTDPRRMDPRNAEAWGWSVKFITPGHFKYTVCNNKKIGQNLMNAEEHLRPISISRLGLRHSATLPAFPRSMYRLEDMEDNGFDDEIDYGFYPHATLDMEDAELQEREDGDVELDSSDDEVEDMIAQIQVNEGGWDDRTPVRRLFQHANSWDQSANQSTESDSDDWTDTDQEIDTDSSCYIPDVLLDSNKSSENKKKYDLGEYVMLTTQSDAILLSTTKSKMQKIRSEKDVISKIDVRTDRLLYQLDRLNMVEWLPELELYVAASQKGTVVLMRILQVELPNGKQICLFNNEHYLPLSVLQQTPLYGMTVRKVKNDRFVPSTRYELFLFYYSGTILGYTISRNDSGLVIDDLIL
ncbi:WD40 repeat-like protein [Backusella circina FSU 941]|nr:WD40 repeat-like protein [Backusella circina FSU 941]